MCSAPVVLDRVVDGDHVRVVAEPRHQPRLAPHPLAGLGARRARRARGPRRPGGRASGRARATPPSRRPGRACAAAGSARRSRAPARPASGTTVSASVVHAGHPSPPAERAAAGRAGDGGDVGHRRAPKSTVGAGNPGWCGSPRGRMGAGRDPRESPHRPEPHDRSSPGGTPDALRSPDGTAAGDLIRRPHPPAAPRTPRRDLLRGLRFPHRSGHAAAAGRLLPAYGSRASQTGRRRQAGRDPQTWISSGRDAAGGDRRPPTGRNAPRALRRRARHRRAAIARARRRRLGRSAHVGARRAPPGRRRRLPRPPRRPRPPGRRPARRPSRHARRARSSPASRRTGSRPMPIPPPASPTASRRSRSTPR